MTYQATSFAVLNLPKPISPPGNITVEMTPLLKSLVSSYSQIFSYNVYLWLTLQKLPSQVTQTQHHTISAD
jgi:hypothetical protein